MLTGFVIGDRGLGGSGDTHPAWVAAYALAGPYLVVGASAIGGEHLTRGRSRDDAFVVRATGRWLAVAVADGVGSRPFSRYGATYVAEALAALLLRPLSRPLVAQDGAAELSAPPLPQSASGSLPHRPAELHTEAAQTELEQDPGQFRPLTHGIRQLTAEDTDGPVGRPQAASLAWWPAHSLADTHSVPPDQPGVDLLRVVEDAFQKTHLGLREHARGLGLELPDLSCTALALLLNLETGTGAAAQVGDGAILALTSQGEVRELLQAPDTGDLRATHTLTRPDFQRHLASCAFEPPRADPFVAFYVMTDGLANDWLYSPGEVLASWAREVDHKLRTSATPDVAATDLLNWLVKARIQGSWDDRTLVAVIQKERPHGDRHAAAEQPGSPESADY